MAVAPESPDPDDSRPDRIEVDIVAKPCEALGVLDQDTLEAALEQMAILLAEAVVAHPERALQPTHAGAQIAFRRLQGQVEVVAHHTVRVENPAVLLARLEKTLLERRLGRVVLEDPRTVVPAIDHMVHRSRVFESKRPRHTQKIGT